MILGMLDTILGGLLAILGGGAVAWFNATARHRQWERELQEAGRQLAVAAAADADGALERAGVDAITMWGSRESTQARVDGLLNCMRLAHESLTKVTVGHPSGDVRAAADRTRSLVVMACNDAAQHALSATGAQEPFPSRHETVRARTQAKLALQEFIERTNAAFEE